MQLIFVVYIVFQKNDVTMEISTLSTTIKSLTGAAQTGKAITTLLDFLALDSRYDKLHHLVIQVQAEYSRLRSDEIGGVLSEEQSTLAYNRLNKKILGIVEKLERNDLGTDEIATGKPGISKFVWIAAGVVVLATAGIFLFSNNKNSPPLTTPPVEVRADCPPLEVPGGFNVLVAGFANLRGPDARPELEIVREINALCKKNGFKAGATLADSPQITTNAEATQACVNCKTQLVVYGTYETIRGDSLSVNVNYKLITDLNLSSLQTEGESGFQAIQTISSIDADGELLSGVSSVINGIFGIVAISNDNVAVAAPYLWEAAKNNQSDTDTVLNRLAADCFVATNQPEKALIQYDAFFAKGGENVVARSNRAAINYVKGNYEAVVRDANVNLTANQADTTSLILRSSAYTKMQLWDKAYKDLEVLQKVKPNDSVIAKKSVEVQEKINPGTKTIKKLNPETIKYVPKSGG